jgi:dCMP deaminase
VSILHAYVGVVTVKPKYKEALMDMAERFAQTSEAERLKVCALIYKNESIISIGINGQPAGWPTEKCEDENNKTLPTVRHGEHAALEKLYLSHETSEGATMFVNYAPCLSCAIKIKTAKIKEVYYRHTYRDSSGLSYLEDNGVKVYMMA